MRPVYRLSASHPHGYFKQTVPISAEFLTIPWILFRVLGKANIGRDADL